VAWLKLAMLAALTLLLASFARSQLFAVSVGLLVWAICEFQDVAQQAAVRGGSPGSRVMARVLAIAFPNFPMIDAAVDSAGAISGSGLLRVALYSAGYAGVVCALAGFSFRRREI